MKLLPLFVKTVERKTVKSERLVKIMISAMKQSMDYYLPKLNSAINFNDFVKKSSNHKIYSALRKFRKIKFFNAINKKESILILIGPEGDFDSSEIEMAKENGFKAVTLGEKRLRTETAALVATHTIALKNE